MKKLVFLSTLIVWTGSLPATVVDLAEVTEAPVVLGQTDILRYSGASPLTTDLVITNNAPSWTSKTSLTFASVFDLQQDVSFSGKVWSGWTGFVKYGPGAMIVDGAQVEVNAGLSNDNVTHANYTKQINFSPTSETAPTQGFNAFCQAQGSIVVNSGSFKVDQNAGYGSIGAWTASAGEQESDTLFEQNGGTSSINVTLTLGAYAGFTDNTPNGPATSTLRVNGGTFSVSGGKYLCVGPSGTISGKTYNSRSLIEVHGGTVNASSTQYGLRMYALEGTDTRLWIDGGTLNATKATGGFYSSYGSSAKNGSQKISICTNGTFNTTIAVTGQNKSNDIPLAIDVFDGGRINFNALKNTYPTRTTTTLTVDGGVLGSYNSVTYTGGTNWITAAGIDVRVGAKGATLRVGQTVTRRVEGPLTTAADITQDGGVVISNAVNGVVEYAAAMAYNGPTVVKGGFLSVVEDGTIPNDAITLTDGGLMLREAGRSVRTLTLGAEGQTTYPKLKIAVGAPLTVTDSLEILGTPKLAVALVDADGNELTEAQTGVTVLTAPASAQTALENLAFILDASIGNSAYQKRVVVSGDTCSLVVDTVKGTRIHARWINPNGGNWADAANWDGGEVPLSQAGVAVTFDVQSVATNVLVHLPESDPVTVGQINFASLTNGYRMTGGTLVFDNGGAGAGVANTVSENAIDADLVLNEDVYVTGADAAARRLSLGGHVSGTGRVILPASVRFGFMKEGFAPTAERCVFSNGGSYAYVPLKSIIGEENNQVVIGGFTIGGTSSLYLYLNEDSTLTVTNGIRLADGVASHSFTVMNMSGELVFGRTTDAIGEGPQSLFYRFYAKGRVRFNSGLLAYTSWRNDNEGARQVVFNGGILRPLREGSGDSVFRDAGTYSLGERGLILDTDGFSLPSASETDLSGATYTALLKWPFQRDPDLAEGTGDGGVTVQGTRGRISIDSNLAGDWTGPLTVKAGSGILVNSATSSVPNLVLGETGATDLVELGVRTDATNGWGLVVSNAVTVLSPVRCLAYTSSSALEPTFTDGASYAVLTYPATATDPDLALFKRDIRIPSAKTSYSIVTVADGDYAGWHQLRMTVAVGHDLEDVAWTATSAGGAWDESANWNGGTPPNDTTAHALFQAAEAADVPVTLSEKRAVGILEFAQPSSASRGYAFSGAALSVSGHVRVPLGTNTFSDLEVADELALWTTNGVNTAVTAKLTGTGRLTVNAEHYKFGGQNDFDTSTFQGQLTTGSGSTTVNDLGFVKDVGDLVLSTGTLYFMPGTDAADETEIPGFTTAGNANYKYTSSILRIQTGKTLAIRGSANSGNCAFNLRGSGTLRLKGTGSFAFGSLDVNGSSGSDSADSQNSCGDGPRSAIRSFTIANGKVVIGTKDDPADAPNVRAGSDMALCTRCTSKYMTAPALEMNNGTLGGAMFYPAYKNNWSRTTPFVSAFNGGSTVFDESVCCHEAYSPIVVRVNGGTFAAANMYMGNAKGGYSRFTFEQNGGRSTFARLTMTSTSYENHDPITVAVNGGTLICETDLDLSRGENPRKVELRLNGGELRYGELMVLARSCTNGVPRLYLGGGVMKPMAAATVCVTNLAIYASTNATTFTTAGYASGDYTIENVIAHDPALETADGGLVKAGANDLVLAATNTFTGPLVVQEGAVRLSGSGSIAGPLVLNGTTFVAPNGAALAGLCGAGVVDGSVATPSMRPGKADEVSFAVSGGLTLANDFTLDLDEIKSEVASGSKIPLCRVAGTLGALPKNVTVANGIDENTDRKLHAKLVAVGDEDGTVVYAGLYCPGMVMIFR